MLHAKNSHQGVQTFDIHQWDVWYISDYISEYMLDNLEHDTNQRHSVQL